MYPANLGKFAGALLFPQPLVFHKPRVSGGGAALKLNLKYDFEFGGAEGATPYLKKAKGGLFVDFAKQGPTVEQNATFLWTDRASLVTAKLGQPDLSGLLVAYRSVRTLQAPVPVDLRPQAREQDDAAAQQRKALTASFTHRSMQGDKEGTTIISYQFSATGGVFRVSKSRELVRQVQLTLAEELRFMRYLELALDTVLRVGGR